MKSLESGLTVFLDEGRFEPDGDGRSGPPTAAPVGDLPLTAAGGPTSVELPNYPIYRDVR